jgi:Zn-dependent protease with chaperone function
MRHLIAISLAVLCFGVIAPDVVEAGPGEARVGETRGTYKGGGTPLRAEPSKTSAPVASLPRGTDVVVEEARKPWLRVRTTVNGTPLTGWIWAFDTVSSQALAPNPPPPQTSRGGAGVSRQDVSAAGRQLDATTERGFRASRRDLEQAYHQVDQMERETQNLQPHSVMELIMEGRLRIHPGRTLARPGRLAGDKDWRGGGGGRRAQPRSSGPGLGGILDRVGKELGVDKGVRKVAGGLADAITERQKQLSERFTPQQEYYLGRAVAAQAIARYGLDPDPLRRRYVRLVGDAVVRLTNRLPANFGGYHFDVLNSDEINGLSGPGGFVFVTRGAVMACRTEDELAGILMHELGHVKLKHGEATLRQGRAFQSMIGGLAGAVAAGLGANGFEKQLVKFFGQAAGESFRIAAENGYGKNAEYAADLEGSYLLKDVFYDHYALRDLLLHIPQRHGGTATHASATARAQALTPALTRLGAFTPREGVKEVRMQRHQKWGQGIGR